MSDEQLVAAVAEKVKAKLEGEGSGHDWWHIYRVWKMAERIGREEGADMFVVHLAALLHDIADWKFTGGDDTVGPQVARQMLEELGVAEDVIMHVAQVMQESSFKGAGVKTEPSILEGKVVQDADRLDAIGAIGIARTFAYGGHKDRILYDPVVKPVMHETKEAYAKNTSPTINHFYEKLLLLKGLMNTGTAKRIAEGRHAYMEEYLNRFYQEWDGVL